MLVCHIRFLEAWFGDAMVEFGISWWVCGKLVRLGSQDTFLQV